MSEDKTLFRLTSISAFFAAFIMVVIAVCATFVWKFEFMFPGTEVLTGKILLSPTEFAEYEFNLHIIYIIDSIFILTWLGTWFGVSKIIIKKSAISGLIFLVLGFAGGFFDFAENGCVISVLKSFHEGLALTPSWTPVWHFVLDFSYIMPFAGSFLIIPFLWQEKTTGKIMAVFAFVFTSIAFIGLYFPQLYFLSFLWFLVWAILSGILLYKNSK